jgi:dTDP-4-dehydrorhamnose reductase
MGNINVLVLGANGMLGSALMKYFYGVTGYNVTGSIRSSTIHNSFPQKLRNHLVFGIDADNFDSLNSLFLQVRPNVVINCIGLVKQDSRSNNPFAAISINSLLPHKLQSLCSMINARLIQISTDCVFSGKRGMYSEEDFPDADDLYGRSKLLGEVVGTDALTIRTSIIGHELIGNQSLINWFLSQDQAVDGYLNAIFSGLPTGELARVIVDFIIPHTHLKGLYHLSAEPISKFELLKLISSIYKKNIKINSSEKLKINRSLNSEKFRRATGFLPKSWLEMVEEMHKFHLRD